MLVVRDVPLGSTKDAISTTRLIFLRVSGLRQAIASNPGTEAYEWKTGTMSQEPPSWAASSIAILMVATSESKDFDGGVGEAERSCGTLTV